MKTKTLRKQLMAAIAMVLVSAIALSSATYAWFVSNNSVTATTSSISAQSNSAFMVIKYNDSAVNSDLMADTATLEDTALFPAQWKNNFDATKSTTGEKIYQFETAFGTDPTADGYVMKDDTLKAVGAPADAVTGQYAVKNTFNISSKGTDLTDLKVSGASIGTGKNAELDNALRVLVVCGDNWVLCDKTEIIQSSNTTAGKIADKVTVGENTVVNIYVYYDGNDTAVYTNNLVNLKDASDGITVTFEATAPTN